MFSIPRPIEALFVVEDAMNMILEVALPRLRNVLRRLELIETKLEESLDRLAVAQVDETKFRGTETKGGDNEQDALEREYIRWSGRLADMLGCPRYQFSDRYKGGGRPRIQSVGVSR